MDGGEFFTGGFGAPLSTGDGMGNRLGAFAMPGLAGAQPPVYPTPNPDQAAAPTLPPEQSLASPPGAAGAPYAAPQQAGPLRYLVG